MATSGRSGGDASSDSGTDLEGKLSSPSGSEHLPGGHPHVITDTTHVSTQRLLRGCRALKRTNAWRWIDHEEGREAGHHTALDAPLTPMRPSVFWRGSQHWYRHASNLVLGPR